MTENISKTDDAPSGFTYTDIRNVVIIIDYAADQGAFKGWDTIQKVQTVRSRLLAVLAAEPKPVDEVEGPAVAAPAPKA